MEKRYDPNKKRQWVKDEQYNHSQELTKNIQELSKEKREALYWQYLAEAFFQFDDNGVALVCPKCDYELMEKRWSALNNEGAFIYLKINSKALLEEHDCTKAKALPKGKASTDLYEKFIEHPHSKQPTYPTDNPTTNPHHSQRWERSYSPSPLLKEKSQVSPESSSIHKQYL